MINHFLNRDHSVILVTFSDGYSIDSFGASTVRESEDRRLGAEISGECRFPRAGIGHSTPSGVPKPGKDGITRGLSGDAKGDIGRRF